MIGFDEIQNDNLIPLAQVEFNNSAAVMGIPAQHQTVLMFGQAAMKSDRLMVWVSYTPLFALPATARRPNCGGAAP